MRTDERVEALAGEYLELLDSGQAPPLEVFLEGLPSVQSREQVGALCRQALEVQAIVERRAGGPGRRRLEPTARFEDFELGDELGRGSMGVVYRARWRANGTRPAREVVALKVLPGVRVGAGRSEDRFAQEIEIARALDHPGVVRVLAWGRGPDGPFFAMDHVDGESLERWIGRAGATGERPGAERIAEAARLAAEIGEALQHAHDHGVVHRDVKPANVLLDRDGRARLSDFGLAKLAGEASLSRTGELVGTAFYMSPEQALMKRGAVDGRSDVFSLGVILYEMLTLERPFLGQSLGEQLASIALQRPAPVRDLNPRVPADLEVLCLRALEKSPDDRFAGAGELAAELRRFLAHEAIRTKPVPRHVRWWRAVRRHPGRVAFAATAALALLAMAAIGRAVGAARQMERMLVPVRELAAQADLRRFPDSHLQAVLGRIEDLRAHGLEGSLLTLVDGLEGRIHAYGRELEEEAREVLERGTGSPPGTPLGEARAGSEFVFYSGLDLLRRADRLLPYDESRALFLKRDPALPRLSATLADPDAGPAEAWLRPIDPVTGELGEARPLGPLPLEGVPIPRGYYRIVVEGPGAFAELSRYLDGAGEELRVEVWLRPTQDVTPPMIRIEGGPFRFGMPRDANPAPEHSERLLEIDSFWIDPHELTNGEYRRFAAATGRPEPFFWRGAYDRAWDDLPVVGISLFDAQRCAEWYGKRLVTHAEWERAGRGTRGRLYPWGDERGDPRSRAVVGLRNDISIEGADDIETELLRYLEGVRRVGSTPSDRTPEGVFDLYGNVAEWTETINVGVVEGRLQPFVHERFAKGLAWESDPQGKDLTSYTEPMVGWSNVNTLGFRCAKSTRPRGK